MSRFHPLTAALLCALLCLTAQTQAQLPSVDFAHQGSSMRLRWNNVGTFGHIACPPFNPGIPMGCSADSIGWEYPLGSPYEHVFGGGIWIGGILDTATTGTSLPLHLASVTYEGWSGPYYEFYPGTSQGDTIWQVSREAAKPADWDAYWGTDFPFRPMADDNRYCRYTDTSVPVFQHVPLHLNVVQSSYTWDNPYADGVHIMEYRITNTGNKPVDSAYVGVFLDADYSSPTFYTGYCYGFVPPENLAYCFAVHDSVHTPFGVALVHSPLPADSVRMTFQRFLGPQSPLDDAEKYALLSSGSIAQCEPPGSSNGRIVLAAGPFTLRPIHEPGTEPLRIAVAYVSATTIDGLVLRTQRARELYLQVTGVPEPQEGLPLACALSQNYPNPFNPTTIIGFQISDHGWVTLRVYDVLGREVGRLVNEVKDPGRHSVQWDASGLSSGVYLYRIEAGGFVQTKSMLLLR